MTDDTPLDDSYVVELLKKDARVLSSRGASALSNPLSSTSGPKHKPNTRFLRNIIRHTDAHNAALLAKEEQESRARLAALNPRRNRALQRPEQALYSARARHESSGTKGRSNHRRTHDRDRQRTRSRSPTGKHRERTENRRIRHSPSPRRSRSPHSRARSPRRRSRSRHRQRSESSFDSSFGPRKASKSPPLRSRGRGAPGASGIDRRFDAEYDPKDDVQPESLGDDYWDTALEAARDRVALRRSRADRLRAAGFTVEEVQASEKGEKDEDSVRWVKKGESREWDRGKEALD